MPRSPKRNDAVTLALNEAIGRIDDDGCEVFGPDEMVGPGQFTRPSPEKISRIAKEVADHKARKMAEARHSVVAPLGRRSTH